MVVYIDCTCRQLLQKDNRNVITNENRNLYKCLELTINWIKYTQQPQTKTFWSYCNVYSWYSHIQASLSLLYIYGFFRSFRVKRIISILLTQLTKRYIENKMRIFALSFVVWTFLLKKVWLHFRYLNDIDLIRPPSMNFINLL